MVNINKLETNKSCISYKCHLKMMSFSKLNSTKHVYQLVLPNLHKKLIRNKRFMLD